jgi:hypothetical protein
MDYVERLVRRALAVPREQAQPLFDPFEQVAPWLPDAPVPAEVHDHEAADTHAAATAALAPAPPVAPPANQPPPAPSASRLVEESILAPHIEPALTPPPPAAPAVQPVAAALSPQVAPPPAHALAPLAHVDAFMRSLGVKSVASQEPTRTRAAAAPDTVPPVQKAAALPRPPDAPDTSAPTVMVRPAPPPAPTPAPEPAQRRTRASPPAPEDATERPPPRRAAPPVTPERFVQTTVVVAPPSRRLDDLAYSSGISRFGIGQV